MNKYLSLFFFLFSTLCLSAQINISISGTVTDTNGDPVEGVEIFITTDSIGSSMYTNIVYTDANGLYSDAFSVDDNLTQGIVYLTMADCNQNWVNATTYWNPVNTDLVVDFTYCEVQNICTAYIDTNAAGTMLMAFANGQAPYTYQWNTGETTESIAVNDEGTYCVSITDAVDCMAEACYTISWPDTTCWVNISEIGTGDLFASATGAAPLSYLWNTGETTNVVTPSSSGLYCVTVTDGAGCTVSDCYAYNIPQDSCGVVIIEVQNGWGLEAIANGNAPFTYQWNTGATSSLVVVNASDSLYCVTVTDATGCAATGCYMIEVPDPDNFQISGTVFLPDSSNFDLLTGQAYLIVYDEAAGTLTAVDTVDLETTPAGITLYNFGDVPAGDYLVKVALSPGSVGYETHLPTYYGNVLWWDEATIITTPYTGNMWYEVVLIEGDNPGGPGFIGGLVSEGANFKPGDEEQRSGEGDPIEGVSVILLDESELPVTYAYTDAEGRYEFPSLAWGTYKVVIEMMGYEQAYYWVTIGPDNPGETELNFEVSETSISTGIDEVVLNATFLLYPNPVNDILNVQFDMEKAAQVQFSILDITGRVVEQMGMNLPTGVQHLDFQVDNYPSGLYLLSIQTEGGTIARKFIKR
jgi:5-hydroxyisourate hydrolase-like protein (transthyretin family)